MVNEYLVILQPAHVQCLANLHSYPLILQCVEPITLRMTVSPTMEVFKDVKVNDTLIAKTIVMETNESGGGGTIYFRVMWPADQVRGMLTEVLANKDQIWNLPARVIEAHFQVNKTGLLNAPVAPIASEFRAAMLTKDFRKAYVSAAAQICTNQAPACTPEELARRLLEFHNFIK